MFVPMDKNRIDSVNTPMEDDFMDFPNIPIDSCEKPETEGEKDDNSGMDGDFDVETGKNSDKKNQFDRPVKFENRRLQEMHDSLIRDMTINVGNLKEKSLMEAAIQGHWVALMLKEKENLKLLRGKREELRKALLSASSVKPMKDGSSDCEEKTGLSKFETAYGRSSALRSSAEIVASNPTIIALDKEIESCKECCQFLEFAWNIVHGFGYTVKNAIETTKLEAGI
jgi:hypothetical protein